MKHQSTNQQRRQSPHDSAFSQKVNSLRAVAANWLMPYEDDGYDGSVERCSGTQFRRPPQLPSAPPRPEQSAMVEVDDETEVIWLTHLVAVVASGVLTMMVWLFTPLSW